MTREHIRRRVDEPARESTRSNQDAELGANSRGLVQSLQRTAGNAAVAAMIGGAAGIQRAANLGPGDELMSPDGEIRPLQTGAGRSGATNAAPAGSGGASGGDPSARFEANLFEQSVLSPLRAAYANARDIPPDHARALEHLEQLGMALWDYEQRYRGKDDGLADGFYATRGWLGRVVTALRERGGAEQKPMSDQDIASNVADAIQDMQGLQGRLR